jgi:hypothetical protein
MPSDRLSVAYDRAVRWPRIVGLLRDEGPLGRSLSTVVLAVAWVATWRPQVDPDAWWHLAIGERILVTGAIPAVEPFSWLTGGERFVAHSWLWDILMALAYRTSGATGTSLLVLPVTASVVAAVWALIGLAAPGSPPLGRAMLVLAATVPALPYWSPRSQTIDVALVLVTVLILGRWLRLDDRRGFLLLPVIGLAWANLHGSAILALAACLAIAAVARPIGARWGTWTHRALGPLVWASAAAIASTFANPYGPALWAYPFDREVASAFSPLITEWQSPAFGAVTLLPARVLLASTFLVAAWIQRRSRDPFLLLVAAAWTFAALGSARFMPIAAPLVVVALSPAVGPAIARWFGRVGGRASVIENIDPEAADRATRQRGGRAAIGIGMVAILAFIGAGWLIIEPSRQAAAIEYRMPVAAVAAFEAAGCDARLMPAYAWAGYVIWFSDREVGAYGNSAERPVAEQAAVEMVATDPRTWLDAHGVEAVLMPADGPLSHWLGEADEWRRAYQDPFATIDVRIDAGGCPSAIRRGRSGSLLRPPL